MKLIINIDLSKLDPTAIAGYDIGNMIRHNLSDWPGPFDFHPLTGQKGTISDRKDDGEEVEITPVGSWQIVPPHDWDEWYRERAHAVHNDDGICEVEFEAPVSVGDHGAYVQAWVFVPHPWIVIEGGPDSCDICVWRKQETADTYYYAVGRCEDYSTDLYAIPGTEDECTIWTSINEAMIDFADQVARAQTNRMVP